MSDATDKKIADALAAKESADWRSKVDQRLNDHEDKLTAVGATVKAIELHLARIDTNFDWIVKVLKWIVGPVATLYGGSQLLG